MEYLQNNPYISTDARKNLQPFILANNKIYLQRYFYYETIIIEKIYTLILNSNIDRNKNLLIENAGFVKNLLDNNDLDNNQISWQMVAIISAVINNFTIITGGPGTGKTTTIAKFLSIVFKMFPDISIALAAPTGKAAARMNQS
ncbi:MAG TPA: exodeoxyribonuclease V subunit alpha, partial [Saprospiraceae bacterium]|nr:exodeoxyribonuclease V subunit alpha [Saprospiraceae bacterium]